MTIKFGPVAWMSGDDYYRPSIWLAWPKRDLVVFLGWQKPSVVCLWR